jgi:hypothetical protein
MTWESMNDVGFDGIGVENVTMLIAAAIIAAGAAAEGKVCKVSANGTVDFCAAGNEFYGVVDKIATDGGCAAVQRKGFRTLAYTGNPGLNLQKLVGNGDGGVMPPAAAVAATLLTGVVATNNAIRFTAADPGADGNNISVQLKDPAAFNQALSVDVVGRDIIVSLATGADPGAITSTAAEVIAAIQASAADDLVDVANEGASTGAGVVAAVALTDLADGSDAGAGRQVFVVSKDTATGTLVVDLG